MNDTPNLLLPYLLAAQSQKHVTHNEALRALDCLVQLSILDRHLTAPPGSPGEGDRYIVPSGATGVWSGKAGQIAAFQDGAWFFYPPREGWIAWAADEDAVLIYDGVAWQGLSSGGGGGGDHGGLGGLGDDDHPHYLNTARGDARYTLLNPVQFGINATADTTNRLAVGGAASLFNHAGSGGHQVKVNKAAAADTASFLFQTGFSGRAEIGLTGDDDFHFKVSANGTSFSEAIIIDRTNGAVMFPNSTMTAKSFKGNADATAAVATDLSAETAAGLLPAASLERGWRKAPYWASDFLANGAAHAPFAGTAIASGTLTAASGSGVITGSHPGVVLLRSSTSANSGYALAAGGLLIGGGEKFDLILRTPAAFTGTTLRFGLLDTLSSADATDGCYFELSGSGAMIGRTANNATRSSTATIATLAASTWYHLRIAVNAAATAVDFTILNDAGVQAGTAQLTTNIPTAAGRETAAGIVATNSGTTATDLAFVDYMAVAVTGRALSRGAAD